jgi:hypothetical protein
MKNLKPILIGGAILIASIAGFFIIKKVRKNRTEEKYGEGKGADSGNTTLTLEQVEAIVDNIHGALSGWTSSQDEEDIFSWLAECKTKADLEWVIKIFNVSYPYGDKLIPWLKSDVDKERMQRVFDKFGVTF